MLSLWCLPQYQALQMHLTSVLLTKRPQSFWYTRETGYLLPPYKQIKENGRAPGSTHASLFRCQGSLASFWVGLRRVFFPRKGQLSKWSQNNLFMRHPWEMFYFQEIWSPCGLLGETLARSFQDLSLPRVLWNTSALSKRAAPSQVVLPGSSYFCFSLSWARSENASKNQRLHFVPARHICWLLNFVLQLDAFYVFKHHLHLKLV